MRKTVIYLIALFINLCAFAQEDIELVLSEDSADTSELVKKIPSNLNAVINQQGDVYLRWECDRHDKLLGYKIYYSMNIDGEYEPFVNGIINEIEVEKRVEQGNDIQTYFFKVASMDSTLVESNFSNITSVDTYDIVAPQIPHLSELDRAKSGVILNWDLYEESGVDFVLLRSDNIEKTPIEIDIQNIGQLTFVDTEIVNGRWYEYSMRAVDKSGNSSDECQKIKIYAEDMSPKDGAKNISINKKEDLSIHLNWEVHNSTAFKFEIYRQVNGRGYEMYKKVLANTYGFIDVDVKKKKVYSYQIRTIYSDGSLSPLSKEVSIEM